MYKILVAKLCPSVDCCSLHIHHGFNTEKILLGGMKPISNASFWLALANMVQREFIKPIISHEIHDLK